MPAITSEIPKPIVRAGLILPRLETPRRPRCKSLGPEAIEWIEASGILGNYKLLLWQKYAITRALELGPDGKLLWETIVLTISRQQGKSVWARAMAWWRIHQAERFGEEQLVLHTSNLSSNSREVWLPAARKAQAQYGKDAAKFGKGSEEILVPDGRWLIQAASENTGVGFSVTQPLVDEAWNVQADVYEEALMPTTAEREQPQTLMLSTAGDSSSTLLSDYREQALSDTQGEGSVLLLEWSCPPEARHDDRGAWPWASPQWTDRRLRFLENRLQSPIGESGFRRQYMNQWIPNANGWIPASTWAMCSSDRQPQGQPDVIAIEVSMEANRYGAVAAWRDDAGTVIVRGKSTRGPADIWAWVEAMNPKQLLLPPSLYVSYTGRRKALMVGSTEMGKFMVTVATAIQERALLHDAKDESLNSDVLRAVAVRTEQGQRLSIRKSLGPIEVARAMVWASGHLMRRQRPRPVVRGA